MLRFASLLTSLCLFTAPSFAATIIYSPPSAAQKTAFVRLDGLIKMGDAKQLEHTLRDAQNSGKQLAVTLASNGGDDIEALAIGHVIRKFHADTYHEYCSGSCALAFLGGERRFLLTDDASAFVVNRPEFADVYITTPSPELKQLLDGLRDYIMQMTGDVRFYSTMMGIPYTTPHTFMAEEALATKAVTAVLR
jgi:hypothetical protein